MLQRIAGYFDFQHHRTCFRTEMAAGITAGFVLYPFFKLVSGRQREVRPGLWVLAALSFLFYVFYPYS